MANAKICDRCQSIMADLTYDEKKERKYVIGIQTSDPRFSGLEYLDLCSVCYDKLVKFMFEDEDE